MGKSETCFPIFLELDFPIRVAEIDGGGGSASTFVATLGKDTNFIGDSGGWQ